MSFRAMLLEWLQGLGIAFVSVIALGANSSVAQITPDGTLPNNSHVRLEGKSFNITGGSQAGNNLFHSFKDFSVPTGFEAFLNNSANIQNIISRVTGGSISNIDGLIKANGTANLFLINPNGIIFGENARLDLGGSFFATSANSMKFADGSEFSAKNPQSTPLLIISVPVGLQFEVNPGLIQVQGNSQGTRVDSTIIDTQDALRVEPDKTLALVGGEINLEGATLKTAGGRIELGSVAGNGLVSLTPTSKGFALGYTGVQNFGNIQLSQQATVDASGEGGGDILLQGKGVTLTDGSRIETSTLGAKPGGHLVVNATESVKLIGASADGEYSSGLIAASYPQATGDGGNLTINTRQLLIQDGAQVVTDTFGAGKGGNLSVTANDIQVIGGSADGQFGSYLSAQANGSTGDAGDLTINTGSLLIQDGAQVGTSTFGAGKGGNLSVTANDIQVIGGSADGQYPSSLSAAGSTGNAGDLTINTGSLLIRDGAQVATGTFGAGKGGNLSVTANDIQVIGRSADGQYASSLSAQANSNSTGDAGNLTINTGSLLIQDGAQVSTSTFGAGKGGNLSVTANDIQVIGGSADGKFGSRLSAQANGSRGDAGDLTINTGSLLIQDGAQVGTSTFGAGKGGNLSVTANDIQVIGRSADGKFGSSLSAQANSKATGNAGDLAINTGSLLIQDGAFVSAGTLSAGKGGNLSVTANDIQVIGGSADGQSPSSLSANGSTGNAGDLTINTGSLLIRDGAVVVTDTFGAGKGGNLSVTANDIQVIGGSADGQYPSSLSAQANGSTGDAGDLTINTGSLLIRNGAQVSTGTFGAGKGGNLDVNAESVELIGTSADGKYATGLFSASRATGNAENLTIKTGSLLIRDGAQVSVSSTNSGKAGDLTVDSNSISLDNAAQIIADTTGGGGNIFLNSPLLLLRGGSSITTNASGENITGGNIIIDAKNGFIVAVPAENSNISADSENSRGGNVTIKNTAGIFGIQPRNQPSPNSSDITVKGATPDMGGNINITPPEVDPSRGLAELPMNLVDAASQISNACMPGSRQYQNMFVATGRGGLPLSPIEPLQDLGTLSAWVRLRTQPENLANTTTQLQPTAVSTNSHATRIMEASTWIADRNGNIELVAQAPQVNPHSPWQASASCPVSQ